MYNLQYKKSVGKDLKSLPTVARIAIVKKILLLVDNSRPNGSVKLRGSDNLYRIRHTEYRIIYQINDHELIIIVVKVAHRKDVYRDF